MKFIFALAGLIGLASAAPKPSSNGFTVVKPGGIKDIVITEHNTLNATYVEDETVVMKVAESRNPTVTFEIENNFSGGPLNMYIHGIDQSGRHVFLGPEGNLIYPSSGGSETPVQITENLATRLPGQGGALRITIPLAIEGSRIYFCEGELPFFMVGVGGGRDGLVQPSIHNLQDPSAGLNYGFAEFTLTPEGVIWTNISFVDFVGLIISMHLRGRDGHVQEVIGLPGNSVPGICNDLAAQGQRDGRPWASHCIARPDGSPLRVLSPMAYSEVDPSAFANYFSGYVDQVWERFRHEDLIINTQAVGDVRCRVNGDIMECERDNRGYTKPSTEDIWGCNTGPFAILPGDNEVHIPVVPRICAALYRTTMLLAGGEVQPSLSPDNYYTQDPTSHYARILHERHVDGKGYAFSYDDVHPDGHPDTAGLIASSDPDFLRFIVGGAA